VKQCVTEFITEQAVRVATRMPRPSPPRVGAVAPRAAEPTAAPADGQRSSSFSRSIRFHVDRYSCLSINATAVSKPAWWPWPFALLTLKGVSELRVTWATSVPILFFPGLSVLDLGPMYATDRQTSDRQTERQTSYKSIA